MLDTDSKERIIKIVVDASGAKAGAGEVEKSLSAIDEKLAALGNSINGAFAGIKNGLLGFFTVDTLVGQVKGLIDAFDRLATKAATLGVSTQWMQAFEYAAASSGVKLGLAGDALDKFARVIGEADQGSQSAVETVNRLGLKIYDLRGNLRPVSDLFVEAARNLAAVDAGAKQNVLSIQAMGKQAQLVIPMLETIGKTDFKAKALDANALVPDEAVQKWAALAASADQTMVKWRSFAGSNFAGLVTQGFGVIKTAIEMALAPLKILISGLDYLSKWSAEQKAPAATAAAMEDAVAGKEALLTRAQAYAAKPFQPIVNFPGVDVTDTKGQIGRLTSEIAQDKAEIERLRSVSAAAGRAAARGGNIAWTPETTGTGEAVAKVTGGGATDADREFKRVRSLEAEAEAQKRMAAAALEGAAAVSTQEAKWKALQQSLEVYGDKVSATDPKVVKLADTFAMLNKSIADDKALTQFRLQTGDIERGNDLLEKRLELQGAAPAIVAREVAAIQVRNEAAKLGITYSEEDINRRTAAVEKQELLNQKIAEQQKAQELWLTPIKQALGDIQTYGTSLWENILKGGKLTFESIGDFAKQMAIRVTAEFLSLATIRPMIGITVGAMTGAGIISPAYASQMGYGSYVGGGQTSGVGGGGLGGGGGWFSADFMRTPIFQSIDDQIAAWSTYGTSAQSSLSLSGLTWGQAAGIGGGLLGMGMGVNSLLSGGGSTGSIIGGAAGILGGGLGIAGALMPAVLGGALGPIGMAVGVLGGILPGLLGGSTPPVITNSTFAQLQYGSGGWGTSGGAWGPSANSSGTESSLRSLGTSISAVFQLLGGVKDASKVWGLAAENKTVSGKDWSSSSDSLYLVDPSGNQQLWRANEQGMMETGSAQVAYRSILEGAAGEISENMRLAVTKTGQTMGGTSLQAIAETVAEILTFDKAVKDLGKTVTTAESAIAQIDASFSAMYATADKYGLATTDVDSAKNKARLAYATDFGKSIARGILEMTDPQAAALQDIDDWKSSMLDNNKWLLENVVGALDQINEIERLYGLKRAAIVEQGTQQSLNTLEDAIKRLTMGDLAGLSPTDALAGAKGTYDALAAQANANPNDRAIANKLGAAGTDYAGLAQSFYASSPAYEAIRQQIVLQLVKAGVSAGGDATANNLGDLTQVLAVLGQQVANLTVQLTTATNDNTEIKARLAEVTALYLRLAGNQ